MENKILVDYFSFTSKFDSPEWLIKLLGFDNPDKPVMFISRSGARGYKDALYFEGVNIFYNHLDYNYCINYMAKLKTKSCYNVPDKKCSCGGQ